MNSMLVQKKTNNFMILISVINQAEAEDEDEASGVGFSSARPSFRARKEYISGAGIAETGRRRPPTCSNLHIRRCSRPFSN